MALFLPTRKSTAGNRIMADGDALHHHAAAVACQQRVPLRQWLVAVQAHIGTAVRQPLLIAWHGSGRQFMAGGNALQAVRIIATASGIDVQKLAGHAINRDLTVLNPTLQAALATAIAQRFPFPVVQFSKGVLLPETFTQLLCLFLFIPIQWCRAAWRSRHRRRG